MLKDAGLAIFVFLTSRATYGIALLSDPVFGRWQDTSMSRFLQCAKSHPIGGGVAACGARRRSIGLAGLLMSTVGTRCETHETFVKNLLQMTGDPLEDFGGRVVVYRGNPKARLMMIGEAPGAEEDKLGIPFVGRSGKLLDTMLNGVGLDPGSDVYVSNIVRRRPPDNRTPSVTEMEYYLPALLEEIRLVDPDIIVTLGASPTKALLPGQTAGITKLRGTWIQSDELVKSNGGFMAGRLLMPWFHPSYLLRNAGEKSRLEGGVRWLARSDVHEVKRTLDRITRETKGPTD